VREVVHAWQHTTERLVTSSLPQCAETNKQTRKSWTSQIVADEAFLGRKKRVQWYIVGRLEHGGCDMIPFTMCKDKRNKHKRVGQIKNPCQPNQAFSGREKRVQWYIHTWQTARQRL